MGKQKQTQTQTTESAQAVQQEAQQRRDELVRGEIKRLDDATETDSVALARFLHEAFHQDYPVKLWGYDRYMDFAAELKIGPRKVYQYVQTIDAVNATEGAITDADMSELGMTKMRVIAPILNKENAMTLLDEARKLTTRPLEEAVRVRRSREGDDTRPIVTKMKLALGESEARPVMDAMQSAKDLLGSEATPELQLAHICLDFLEHQGVVPQNTPIDSVVKWIEKAYRVKVTWTPTDTAETAVAQADRSVKEAVQQAKTVNSVSASGVKATAEVLRQDLQDLLNM